MLKRIHIAVVLSIGMCGIGSVAEAATQTLCPGQNSVTQPTNLACEIVDATHASYTSSTAAINTAIAAQFGQLPLSTAVSGSGLSFNSQLGVFTATKESLGTILTQRAETLGKNKFSFSFAYQHFGFGHVDGIGLKALPTLADFGTGSGAGSFQAISNVSLEIDQYAVLGAYGLTKRVDVAVMVPFSHVNLSTRSILLKFYPTLPTEELLNHPGSANGIGDVTLDVKANVLKAEHTSMALGGEVRFPSGDAANFLGSGAYGIRPYLIVTHHGWLTTSLNLGYQWNSSSILFQDANGNANNLPSSFLYSGGADYGITKKITLVAEFLGQCVFSGPRLAVVSSHANQFAGAPAGIPYLSPFIDTYSMNNLGGGVKANPFQHLYVNANVMFSLDSAGLRSKITPLAGVSYNF